MGAEGRHLPRLFCPERLHGVDFGGACGRQPHGDERNRGKMSGTETNTGGIPGLDTEKEGGDEPRQAECRHKTDDNADKSQPHPMPNHELADVPRSAPSAIRMPISCVRC